MDFSDNRSLGWVEELPRPPGARGTPGGTESSEDYWRSLYRPIEVRGVREEPARHRARRGGWSPSLAGVTWLAAGIGLCLDGAAVTLAPRHPGVGLLLFWAAILIPFVTFTTVLLAARPSRVLRELTVLAVGVYPALLSRMSSPLVLGGFDEHIHERSLLDLLRGSGLFAPNPILPVSAHYTGMEWFTGVVVRLTGMPVMLAMVLVVLLCRLLLVLTIYHGALTVNPSRWGASLVVILYAASPQFYFFNSQFAYQTMALMLGLGGLYLLRRAQLAESSTSRRWLSCLATLSLVATVVTHHVTSWIVLGFLVAWTVFASRGQRKVLVCAAAVMGVSVVLWTGDVVNRLAAYLGPVMLGALREFELFAGGANVHRKVFSGSGGSVTPEWERVVLIFYSLTCTCAAIICGWVLISRAFRKRDRMLGLLGVLSLAYPLTVAAHFVPTSADLGDRSSTFLFLPLALSCSLVARSSGGNRRVARRRSRAGPILFLGLIATTYLGGVMLGEGPDWNVLPGPYLVSAEARTQDPETLAAVQWAAAHLPPGSRVVADRVPADLLAAQARLWPVMAPEHGLQAAGLYFADFWGPQQTAIVKGLHIRYLYVDRRLAYSLPRDGFYFYPGESLAPKRITTANLAKFSHVPGLKAVYQHGAVTIYSTAGLGVTSTRDGFTGQRSMGLGRLGDGIWGAVSVLLVWGLGRWFARTRFVAPCLGRLEIGLSVMAITTLVGGALFGLRLMPGPTFTIGAVLALLLTLALGHKRASRNMPSSMPLPRRLDPLVFLGVLAGIAGLAIGLHAAWAVDVTAVDSILRAVAAGHGS
jgi:hypothetical protein